MYTFAHAITAPSAHALTSSHHLCRIIDIIIITSSLTSSPHNRSPAAHSTQDDVINDIIITSSVTSSLIPAQHQPRWHHHLTSSPIITASSPRHSRIVIPLSHRHRVYHMSPSRDTQNKVVARKYWSRSLTRRPRFESRSPHRYYSNSPQVFITGVPTTMNTSNKWIVRRIILLAYIKSW